MAKKGVGNLANRTDLVVYTRSSKDKGWEKFRTTKKELIKQYYSDISGDIDYQELGQKLIDLGEIEQQKELNLLRTQFYNNTPTPKDVVAIVQKFNEVLQGKDEFDKAVQRLNFAIEKNKKEKEESNEKGQLAPYISSILLEKLPNYLLEEMDKFLEKHSLASNLEEEWASECKKPYGPINAALEKAINEALNNYNMSNTASYLGISHSDYTELAQLWKNVYNKAEFYNLIKDNIGVQNFQGLLGQRIEKKQKKEKILLKDISSGLKFDTNQRKGQVGGTLAEYLTALVQNNVQRYGGIKAYSAQMHSKVAKTDIVTVMTTDVNVTSKNIVDKIQAALSDRYREQSLEGAAKALKKINGDLEKLNNTFIIYTSQKMYGMGKSFKGFHTGTDTQIKQLISIGKSIPNTNLQKIQELVSVAYNVIPKTILARKKNEVEEKLRAQIAEWFAYVLFDDWVSIGDNSSTQALHVMNLDGVNIPISILLKALGKLLQKGSLTNTILQTSFHFPEEILYPKPDYPDQNVSKAWKEQAAESAKQTTFSTKILTDFKAEIKKFIDGQIPWNF